MSGVKFRLIKEINNDFIRNWKNAWEGQGNSHFFNSPEWFIACLNSFNFKEYFIFVGTQDRKIKVILPLIRVKKFGINFFVSPGGKYLDKSTIFFVDDINPIVIGALIEKTLEYGNIYLAEADKRIRNIITDLQVNRFVRQSSINPYISLDFNPFRFMKNKSKNEIKNKIKKYADYSFKICTDFFDKHIKTVFYIENNSFKRKRGRNIFDDKIARRLFLNIIRNREHVLIFLLYFKNKPIAHMVGLVYQRIFLAYHMAYLENYRKLIPGKVLLYFLLPELKKQKFDLFDFSRGDNFLKRQFTQQKKVQYDVFLPRKKMISLYLSFIFFIKDFWLLIKRNVKLLLNRKYI